MSRCIRNSRIDLFTSVPLLSIDVGSFPATRSTQLLNYTTDLVLELQEKALEYSHDSRLQTRELHELLRN